MIAVLLMGISGLERRTECGAWPKTFLENGHHDLWCNNFFLFSLIFIYSVNETEE
jgi:hypothetical protein